MVPLFSPSLLSGKVALITGASSGLGAHFAKTLAAAGAEVILSARREEALERVAAEITAAAGACSTVRMDVGDEASIAAAQPAFDRADILINNAGIVSEQAALEVDAADWDRVMTTNLKGMFLCSQAMGRSLRSRGRSGSIVNICSILGIRQASNVLPYAVSKAGAIQMTKVLGLEFARHGIRVNALAPGYIATDLNAEFWESSAGKAMLKRIPQRRLGCLEDLDGPVLLLASDAGAYITGSVLAVDGGHLVSTL